MSISKVEVDGLRLAIATSLHEHWVFYLVEGIVLIGLGTAAIVVPAVATLAVTIFLGWLFLISGIVGLFTTFWMRGGSGFLVVSHFSNSGHSHRGDVDRLARTWSLLADLLAHCLLHHRGRAVCHVRP